MEGANITLGSADKITKYDGTAVTSSDRADYVLKSDGAINVGYEVEKTAVLDVGDSQTHNALSNYSSGTVAAGSSKGSTVFSGRKADGMTDNTVNDYMLVHDIYELQNVQTNRNGKYMLADNIEAGVTKTDSWHGNAGFTPLFGSTLDTDNSWFTGTFDGNGYKIKDLYINNSTNFWVGLFGKSAGKITNVNLENIDYQSTDKGVYVGGILGENVFGGSISNVQVSGKIAVNNDSKSPYVGGIVGSNGFNTIGGGTAVAGATRSVVKNALSKVDITVTGSCTQANVGGIAGKNNYYIKSDDTEVGFIENVRNEGSINVDINQSYVGGIIGTNIGGVQQAGNIGTVKGKWYTGGIIGSNDGSENNGFINNDLFNGGTVSGTRYVGGIIGQNMGGKFSDLGNTGSISGTDNTAGLYVGGIIGYNTRANVRFIPVITNAYNTGSIRTTAGTVGSYILAGVGDGISIKNTFFFNPNVDSYYDYNGTEYKTTKEFNQAFMDGIESSGDKNVWLYYSGGQTTPQFAKPLQPLEINVGDIEIEIAQGSSYTELAQTIASKMAAQGLDIEADKILSVVLDQAGEYALSELLYSTQDGYRITVGDGGKLVIKIKADVPQEPPVGPDVPATDIDKIAGSSQYHAALVNITASEERQQRLRSEITGVTQPDEENKKIKVKGRGIKI